LWGFDYGDEDAGSESKKLGIGWDRVGGVWGSDELHARSC